MKTQRLTVRRLTDGRYAVVAGREIIDIYKDKPTATAARDYATWVSWSLKNPKAAGR
jgi:hypothetical protein